jgi:hypothetical protein
MEHTTTTDMAALEAEIDALAAAAVAQDARIDALLARQLPPPVVTTWEALASLRAGLAAHSDALDEIEREQAEISAALDALEAD